MNSTANPKLSVVVVIVGDTVQPRCDCLDLAGTLDALLQQVDSPTMEIIVPFHSNVDGVDQLKARNPKVNFLFVENMKSRRVNGYGREHHDELRARGAAVARGEIIAFLEDHVRPNSHWAAQVLNAHCQTYAVIGGAIENGINRTLNWAVYFCDLGKYQNPVPAGESSFASTVNNSYKHGALERIRSTWQDMFNETVVNSTLMARGEKIALSPEIVVYQFRDRLRLKTVMLEFFIWGRSYATIRSKLITLRKQIVFVLLSPLLPIILLARIAARVGQRGRTVAAFVRAFPLAVLLTLCWSLGELAGYVSSFAYHTPYSQSNPLRQGRGS